MAVVDTSGIIPNSSYDDATGNFQITVATGMLKEQAVLAVLLAFEAAAQAKRTNLNFPISEKAFPDDPAQSFVNRANADGTDSETQVEYQLQLVMWFKNINAISAGNAVIDSD